MMGNINPQSCSSLRQKFKEFSPGTLDLLCSLLSFNPDNRLTAQDYFTFPVFSDIRNAQLETNDVQVKINLSIDRKNLKLTEAEQL